MGVIADIGRCYSLKLIGSTLWASVSPLDQKPAAPGWLLRLNAMNGEIEGYLDIPDEAQGHELNVLPSGEPIVTTSAGLIWFKHLVGVNERQTAQVIFARGEQR